MNTCKLKLFSPLAAALVLLFLGGCALPYQVDGQEYQPAVVGFYNVENLFDTVDSPDTNDEEYLPDGSKGWTEERYREKLANMARVISEIGTEIHPSGVQILGLSEIENRQVVEDLINTGPLADRNYGIVHYDSPDRRGVDVGLIYQKDRFKVFNSKSYCLTLPNRDDFFTRDQLLVSGVLDGDTVHVIVVHWPSRRGGEKKSMPLRMAAAELGRSIVDSIQTENPNAAIFYMGDLNDDPVDPSVRRGLRSSGKAEKTTAGMLFNPMEDLYNKGIGSLAYRDNWNLFDQVLVSEGGITPLRNSYRYFGAKVFNKPYLRQQEGNFAGYPFRTHVGNTYKGGFSDHFPVYLILVRDIR
jgi:hypothetical protein